MSDTTEHPTAKKMRDEIERSKAALEMVGKDREHYERELERCLAEIARLRARAEGLEKSKPAIRADERARTIEECAMAAEKAVRTALKEK